MNLNNIEQLLTSTNLTRPERVLLDGVTELILKDMSTTYESGLMEIIFNQADTITVTLDTVKAIRAENLKNVKRLYLSSFRSNYVPDFVFRLPALEDLELNMIMNQEILKKCASLKKLKKLDIHDASLSDFPECLCEMKNLKELRLDANSIRIIPDTITRMTRLEVLSLESNGLHVIPEIIFSLPSLKSLKLRSNSLSAVPSSIRNAKKLEILNLNVNDFTEFPEEILCVTSLRRLDLSQNKIKSIPDQIRELTELNMLNLSGNGLETIPDGLFSLSKLVHLNLATNLIHTVPEITSNLSGVRRLDLSFNQIRELPGSIGELTNLQVLDVGNNHLEFLPESISSLSELEYLSASDNNIKSLPGSIGRLSKLQKLDVTSNRIKEIPDSINQLNALETLYLSGNNISYIPFEEGCMQHLHTIFLSSNPIDDISFLENIKDTLGILNLGFTEIDELPEVIRKFKNLVALNISHTKINRLPDWLSELKILSELNVSDLKLESLPFLPSVYKYGTVRNDRTLSAYRGLVKRDTNLLLQPASLFDQPYELIEDYYMNPRVQVSEAKIIFIGYGNKGKTYTLQRILHDDKRDEYKTQQTHGINICDYNTVTDDGKELKITFWDFGGQQIMHSMHRCFLTERTGYVIFLDTRDDDSDTQAEKWIKSIRSFAPDAKILVYVNLWDTTKRHRVNEQYLKYKYGVEVISCSSKCAADEEFHEKVTKQIVSLAKGMDSYVMEIPEKWNSIRNELLSLKSGSTYYITLNQYFEICKKYGESDRSISLWLLDLFNDMGECFSFGEKALENTDDMHTTLNEYRVLEPKWLTKGIYSFINDDRNKPSNGEIQLSSIESSLRSVDPDDDYEELPVSSYTKTEVTYILEIMRKFRMSYKINDQWEFIPSLITTPENKTINLEPDHYILSRKYELVYEYLPDALIHQVMVECYRKRVLPSQVWSKGFVYESEMDGIFLTVNGNGSDNTLRVSIYTLNESAAPQNPLQWMLNVIRQVSIQLNLKAKEWVLPEDGIRERISVEELNDILYCGETIYTCPDRATRSMARYDIRELLCKYVDPKITDQYLQRKEPEAGYSEQKLIETIRQQIPESSQTIIYNNFGGGSQVINNIKQQQILNSMNADPEKWLVKLAENQDLLSNDILDRLGDLLEESENKEVRAAGEKIKKAGSEKDKKSWFTKAVEIAKGGNEGFKLADNVVKYWPDIVTAARALPRLWDIFIHLH